MHTLWPLLTGLLITGWFALDGFSIGTAAYLPLLRHDPPARNRAVAAIGPFFLAGEVWLIAFAGVLALTFPAAETRLFARLHPVIVTMIAAWLVRDAAMWFRARRPGPRWRARWETTMAAAATTFAASTGLLLGNAIQNGGAPLNPYALLTSLTVVTVFFLHGTAFLTLRTTGESRAHARRTATRAAPLTITLLALLLGAAPLTSLTLTPATFIPGLTGPLAAAAAWLALRRGRDGLTFAATLVTAASLPLTAGGLMTGSLPQDVADPGTLERLAVVALPIVPLLLAAQALLWWMHRRRVSERTVTFF
ncbi:cytochrome d ubiquinol oxidase subunit II [Nonomuraea sp. NPDC004580]|uniref:cytochrome d ubiquinol oxidase subunit II n=1 Tax=Nonomuraea sp. NPDC004580 TaxID=3154552 RepID=UPI0033BE5050